MGRRNSDIGQQKRRKALGALSGRADSFEAYARDLVRRGLATEQILSPRRTPKPARIMETPND